MHSLALLLLALGQTAPTAPSTADLEQAARLLKSDRFEDRERGYRELWKAGRAAQGLLQRLAAGEDREAAERARALLDLHRYGLYPDTPPDVAQWIRQFRQGDTGTRHRVLEQLQQEGHMEAVLRLVRLEQDDQTRNNYIRRLLPNLAPEHALSVLRLVGSDEDPQLRGAYLNRLLPHLTQLVRQHLGAGHWDEAEEILRLAADADEGGCHLAAFLLLRGQLEDEVQRLQKLPQRTPPQSRQLAFLLRARGDLRGAVEASRDAQDPWLTSALQMELRDWKALSDGPDVPPMNTGNAWQYEQLGFMAAIHQLAGRPDRCDEALDKLRELAEGDRASNHFYAVEALLILGRLEQGLELLEKSDRQQAMQVLAAQHRPAEALRSGGADVDPQQCRQRIEELAKAAEQDTKTDNDFKVAVELARIADSVGMTETADHGFERLAKAAAATSSSSRRRYRYRELCDGEVRAGRKRQAFQHAVDSQSTTSMFTSLYGNSGATTAQQWWKLLLGTSDPLSVLSQIDRLMKGSGDTPDWRALEQRTAQGKLGPAYWKLLAEAAQRRDDSSRAEDYFRRAAEEGDLQAARSLGDFLRQRQQWDAAAEQYLAASSDKTEPLAVFLAGDALIHAGRADEGRELCELAMLLPLGGARKDLGTGLQSRQLEDAARRCWELGRRTMMPRSWDIHHAGQQLGNLVSDSEPLLAADLWQHLTMSTLKTATSFNEPRSYLRMPHLVHKTRARGLLAAGQTEGVSDLLEQSRRLMPGDISLAEDLVPELERAGLRQEAEQLFGKMYDHLDSVCRDFPRSSLHHNNLAWLAARCGRRLEDALQHAQTAVELSPDSPTYLDTLAEVHYRRGDVERAIELARKCQQLDPREEHYGQQLERFQAGGE